MVQKLFDINNLQGLSDEEVMERLAQDGYNELPSTEKRTIFHILFEVIREPMFLLLIVCGGLIPGTGGFPGSHDAAGFRVRGDRHHDLSGTEN